MSAPENHEQLLKLIRASGLVEESRLQRCLHQWKLTEEHSKEPGKLATLLARAGLVTVFQAEQLLQGKWRRFSIGRYAVLERLGSGVQGSVYLCSHQTSPRLVAVKVLPASNAQNPAPLERFYRQARALAALNHPSIVRAYDIDQDETIHFLVMEHVNGSSLQEIIKRSGPMDVLRAIHYGCQAAEGLQHMHEAARLVHRDIEPGNLMLDRQGRIKIIDLGLARFSDDEADRNVRRQYQTVLGTADYMAPEQSIDSHIVDIRADLYGLGGVIYYLLAGHPPCLEGTQAQRLIWKQPQRPRPIREVRPDTPPELGDIVERMMAMKREERYQTPADVIEAFGPWRKIPIPPPPESEMPRWCPAVLARMSSTP